MGCFQHQLDEKNIIRDWKLVLRCCYMGAHFRWCNLRNMFAYGVLETATHTADTMYTNQHSHRACTKQLSHVPGLMSRPSRHTTQCRIIHSHPSTYAMASSQAQVPLPPHGYSISYCIRCIAHMILWFDMYLRFACCSFHTDGLTLHTKEVYC